MLLSVVWLKIYPADLTNFNQQPTISCGMNTHFKEVLSCLLVPTHGPGCEVHDCVPPVPNRIEQPHYVIMGGVNAELWQDEALDVARGDGAVNIWDDEALILAIEVDDETHLDVQRGHIVSGQISTLWW